MPPWLPPLVQMADYGNDWDEYLAALYQRFSIDFLGARPLFDGRPTQLKRHPVSEGKEATFWHFISDGSVEADRLPNLRRCERIAWPRAIMDNCADPCVKMWREARGSSINFHLWCEEAMYLVVVADRGSFVLPWTAYPIEYEHQARKLNARWEKFRT